MEKDNDSVIQMLQNGVKRYLLKSIGSEELLMLLKQTVKLGYYYTPIITGNIHKQIEIKNATTNVPLLTDREKELLDYLCTDCFINNRIQLFIWLVKL